MGGENTFGFRVGERIIVRQQGWGRASRRGVILGPTPDGLAVRVERDPSPATIAPVNLFHDTPAFYAWLDADFPPGGGAPSPATFGRRKAAMHALLSDNPHLPG